MAKKERTSPKLRFPGFTEPWEQRKFGDVGSVTMCKRIFKEETSAEGEVPFFKIGTFGGTPDAYISRELFEEYKRKFSYPSIGDILVSASGTIGRTVEYTGADEYFQDSNIVWLKHTDDIVNSFLKILYEIVEWNGIEGTTIKRLYNENFLTTKFMLPSVSEQQKIGSYFEQLDHLITLHQRKCDALRRLKTAMLKKMFPRNGEAEPELRFPGFTEPWEQRKLSDAIVDIADGPFGSNLKTEHYTDEKEARIIQLSNLSDYGWQEANTRYTTFEHAKEIRRCIVNEGELVMGKMMPAGMTIIRPNTEKMYVLSSDCVRIKLDKNVATDDFFLYTTKSETFLNQVNNDSQGSTRVRTSISKIREMAFATPSLEEQAKIGEYFTNLDNLITLHQRKYDALKKLKQAMMQKMFV